MSVILSDDDFRCPEPEDSNCSICGGGLSIPYIQWMGTEGSIFFCNHCCGHIYKGLVADFVQVRAINELRALGYPGATLARDGQVSLSVEKFLAAKRCKEKTSN
jgi:hypothetical protein